MARSRARSAAQVAPGSTILPIPLAEDLPLDVRRRSLLAGLRLDSRAGCVAAYERLLRAAVGGMITPVEMRLAIMAVKGAAEQYMERGAPAGAANRPAGVKRAAIEASRADPDVQPDPPDPEPEPDEPTFEEKVEAAVARRAARAGGV